MLDTYKPFLLRIREECGPQHTSIFHCHYPKWHQGYTPLFVAGLKSQEDTRQQHTSRTVTGSPAKSHFPSSLFQNCISKQSIIYLLPDRVVAKKAPDFTPGERPGGVGISVSRKHFNIQGLQLACVECPARQRTCLKINKLRCPPHRSQKESSADSQRLSAHGEKCHRFPVIP